MMYHEEKCPSAKCQMAPELTEQELKHVKEITELKRLCNEQIDAAEYWRGKYISATGCKIINPVDMKEII